MTKDIDPVEIKSAVKRGQINFYLSYTTDGRVRLICEDLKRGEAVFVQYLGDHTTTEQEAQDDD